MPTNTTTPSLFGLQHSNRDFSQADAWGKNNFNSAFPASLVCYMHSLNLDPVYITFSNTTQTAFETISASQLFGADPSEVHFAFETDYTPYHRW
jgi:hypothetical protein